MARYVFPREPVVLHSLPMLQKQSSAVAELGLQALRAQNAQEAMEDAVRVVADVMDHDLCKILELMPDKEALLVRAGVGWRPGIVGHGTVSAGLESQAGYTLMKGRPVVANDLPSEKRFDGPPLLHHHGVVSGMSTPIYTTRGPWGVIGVHSKAPHQYSSHDQDFLVAVANVLGAAIDRERHGQELSAANERLERWNRMRASFLHNVAHELRTPLTPLAMQLQSLDGMKELMEPSVAYGIRVARRGVTRLQTMINSFVELAQLQSNAILLEKRYIDLAQVARHAATKFQVPAQEQGITLHLERNEAVWVDGHAASLQSAIAALIENALHFTAAGGTVSVSTTREGDFGVLVVADDGAGLRADQIPSLFESFTQASLVEKASGGIGVGLAIAKEIVDLHGGRVGVESPGPGKGSRFWFRIRLSAGERLTDRT